MTSILKKEIFSFFSSVSGYLVAGVFLLVTSLFLWIIPGNLNIPFGGYASLDSLFELAPWVYLFLVPAVTMRLFSEEKKTGTMELLLTKPITDWQIVVGKYLAGVILIVCSLLPTLIFYLSVNNLAQPVGNIDHGAIFGSYIGLFLLAAVYAAIGLFTSSLSNNQVVAFVLAVVGCFLFYSGFQAMTAIPFFKQVMSFIIYLGIDEHYQSISRGIVDSRDIVYFFSVIFLFLLFTKARLKNSG
ncbi:MAG: gliding motility-associated ABC transporter permease subunit GldF [Marinilabiliaceae bacterium]|nr:gliding motility-associated ABC transporter permease subunit GldF [Marinilabiliaceae bacterium]